MPLLFQRPHCISEKYEVTFIKDNKINDRRISLLEYHVEPCITIYGKLSIVRDDKHITRILKLRGYNNEVVII